MDRIRVTIHHVFQIEMLMSASHFASYTIVSTPLEATLDIYVSVNFDIHLLILTEKYAAGLQYIVDTDDKVLNRS